MHRGFDVELEPKRLRLAEVQSRCRIHRRAYVKHNNSRLRIITRDYIRAHSGLSAALHVPLPPGS
jgi:hypothetical protein